ncbi:hypothetical protein QO010_002365 [Caulobacter ginsengisoli]|uniref:Cell wall polymerase n=1 Tax=Caulobacter ginsengisoli TaxID=400775 RepID=A0ABU0IT90_9CAUL|nr:hypothetical protein [Caulobacter ginsengisoli]MDQ0464581.1 hypothetical protein [Caulobacter ginsengisoli]
MQALPVWCNLAERPRRTATLCAVLATGLGLAYLVLAGAPGRYVSINIGAMLLGLVLLGAGCLAERVTRRWSGPLILAGGVLLLLTSQFGASLDGAQRWIVIHGLVVQPSLLLLPVMAVGFAGRRDTLSTTGMIVAALALALQPDRAMAGALVVSLIVLALVCRAKTVMIALAAAVTGFTASLLQADQLPVQPFVEQVFLTAFAAHPLAGPAVILGAGLMILPALTGSPRTRPTMAVFGAVWLAILAATVLGHYPTPVVGYGGSGVIGYLISLIGLPKSGGAEAAK